jgi:iron complex outermembrane recepter protein
VKVNISVSVAAFCLSLFGLSHGAAQGAENGALAKKPTNIPEQGLGPALQQLATQRNLQLVYVSEEVDALRTSGAIGILTHEEALTKLLSGTGLTFKYLDDRTITILPIASKPASSISAPAEATTVPRNSSTGNPSSRRGATLAPAISATFIGMAGANQAFAQLADPNKQGEVLDEVVVTGIRGSLARATEIKRNSDQIVDSIASESLGKFPDSNIAESLQRISGVSIDRSGGEGQAVTVRGFGPQFNTVLLNGRRIASDTGARSFNFDVLPAELISRVDVYKSAAANLEEGGIGSTIMLHTPRPLDINGFKAITSARALYEDLSDEVTPQVFGMISNRFAEGRFGALLSASYQERENRVERFLTDGYLTASRDSMTLIASDLAAQRYAAEDQFFIPQNLNISPVAEHRERTNINATLQFQPTENLRLTVDGMYDEFTVSSESDTLGFFVTPSIITGAQFDENRTATQITQTVDAAIDFVRSERDRPTDTYATGLNVAWELSESVSVALDSSWSRTRSRGANGTNVAVLGFRNPRDIFILSYGASGLPSVSGISPQDIVDPSLPLAHFTLRGSGGGPLGGGADLQDQLAQHRIEARWEPEGDTLKRVSFGAAFSHENQSTTSRVSDNTMVCLYCGYFVDVPDSVLRTFSPSSGYLGGKISIPSTWQTFDIDELIAFLESSQATTARDVAQAVTPGTSAALVAASNGYEIHMQPSSSRIKEDILSFYTSVNLAGTMRDIPWGLTLGARYARTETTPFGISQPLLDLVDSGDPTLFIPVLGDATTVSQTNTYDDVLPSLDFRVNLTPNVIARFAVAKTVTRPPLGALSPRVVIGTTRPGNLQASSGNPDLQPFASKNADLSFEWYYQENGFATLGLFYKKVDNFLVNTVENQPLPILDSDNLFTGDPVFEVSLQDNLENATVKGVEVGFQHHFDWLPGFWSGFGFGANATFVDSDAQLNVEDVTQTFALEGLGDSYNAIGYYEKGRLEVRMAWNRRERFLQTAVGFGGEPTFVQPFSQIDARASFAITPNFSVFAEGVNIGNERTEKVGRFDNQILLLEETGPRYSLGIRAEF